MKIKGYRTTLPRRGKERGQKFCIFSEKPASYRLKKALPDKSAPFFPPAGNFFSFAAVSAGPVRTVFTLSSFISENDGVK
jgi:hypothetical protein